MFFYTVDFTHQFFPPLNLLHCNQDCLGLNDVENGRHTQSHWIVTLLLHDDWDFYAVAHRAYFLCCTVKQHWAFLFHPIARRQAIRHCNMQRLLLGYNVICPNATIKQYTAIARSNNKGDHIFCVVLQEKQQKLYFWCCKKQWCSTIARREGQLQG